MTERIEDMLRAKGVKTKLFFTPSNIVCVVQERQGYETGMRTIGVGFFSGQLRPKGIEDCKRYDIVEMQYKKRESGISLTATLQREGKKYGDVEIVINNLASAEQRKWKRPLELKI